VPALNSLVDKLYDGTHTYGDLIHFLHIYVVEPHPKGPDIAPNSGTVWEGPYSTLGQAFTYDDRVTNAANMIPLITGNQIILIDDLRPNGPDNPLWCTYGPCPNCAYLIGQDGTIKRVQRWISASSMETSMIDLLSTMKIIESSSTTGLIILILVLSCAVVCFFLRYSFG